MEDFISTEEYKIEDIKEILYNRLKEKYNYLDFNIVIDLDLSYTNLICYKITVDIYINDIDIIRLKFITLKGEGDCIKNILGYIDDKLEKDFRIFVNMFCNIGKDI